MTLNAVDIAVIGAGPAGLSAAIAAANVGAKVAVLDAGLAPGGQYWMQGIVPSLQAEEGRAAVAAAAAAGVTIHSRTEVWGVFDNLRICALREGAPMVIEARAMVIAGGAHDRVMPFPGWTLPGVMTAGAGQRLAKLAGMPAGRRVVLAGSGPFLLAVAKTLRSIDAVPVALIEAQRSTLGPMGHLARHPRRWREALELYAAARAIPERRRGWVVTEAIGTEHIEAVRIAPLVDDAPDLGRSITISDVDALLIGWGFRPSIEIAALLRCALAYDRAAGGWFCRVEQATGATSVEGVYAAGEVTGVAGARPAEASGLLAGLSAAAFLDFDPAGLTEQRRAALAALRDDRRFAAGLNRLYEPPKALSCLATADTIVCRCESVTRREIDEALRAGASGVLGVKHWTRAGMGPCQGRSCGWAVAEIVAEAGGQAAEAAGFNAPRLPLWPVPLDVVLEATREQSATRAVSTAAD